jgi:hypothetical protein
LHDHPRRKWSPWRWTILLLLLLLLLQVANIIITNFIHFWWRRRRMLSPYWSSIWSYQSSDTNYYNHQYHNKQWCIYYRNAISNYTVRGYTWIVPWCISPISNSCPCDCIIILGVWYWTTISPLVQK